MSNIFDALNKRQPERPASRSTEPLVPLEPPSGGAPLPASGDIARDQDMERLRQRVLLELGTTAGASVVFAGSVEGEGATTLALLFARELAQAEQRPVLLVDADIEGYPRTLTGTMRDEGGELGPGLADLLLNRAKLTDCLLGTELPNLHFLPRGSDLGPALDLVQTQRVRTVLDEIQRHYAFVVLDGAPLVDSPESSLLAAATDGVVLVVRANRTRREVVQRGLRLLHQSNCQVLGAVLNDRKYPIPSFLYRRL
ncbi:MAG: CpsD/CapB family tyrosine-protein kinase [Candidatus Eisenbacteria bacterium]